MESSIKGREFYRNKLEIPLFILSLIISIVVFVFLSYLGYKAIRGGREKKLLVDTLELNGEISDIMLKIGGYISIIVLLIVIVSVVVKFYLIKNNAYGRDVHVTEGQFALLIKAEKEYAEKLGIKKLPEMFVVKDFEKVELHGARFEIKRVIRIPSLYLISTANDEYYAAKFFIAEHLAAIYMGYFSPLLFVMTLFSNWIPVLSHMCSRTMIYATDKIASELVGKEDAMKSIMISETDIYLLPYVNVNDYMINAKKVAKNKHMFFANILSDIPIPSYRIDALRNDKDGKLF